MRDSPMHIPPTTTSSHSSSGPPHHPPTQSNPHPPPTVPQSNLTIFSADSEYIRNFLSSVPSVFPVSPGAMLAELTGYAPMSPSHGQHFSLHSSPSRQTPSPHRNFFPSPGYPSLIPRIGGGTNKHVYAPILPPSRLYDSTPVPSPPPPLLHDPLSSVGAVSPVRRVSQEAPREKAFENNSESGANDGPSSGFTLTTGLIEDPGSPIQTEFGDESMMQLTATGENQDNSQDLVVSKEDSKASNKKQEKRNKAAHSQATLDNNTLDTSDPKKLSLKPKLASCEMTPVEESAKQVADKLSKGCNCERNCYKDLDPVMVFDHRKSISKLTKGEHDMYLMGVMSATLRNPSLTSKKKERLRNRNKYIYKGTEVCQEAYIYLENVSSFHLKSIRLHITRNGVEKRSFKINCHGKTTNTYKKQSKRGAIKTAFVKCHIDSESIKMECR